jgi:hypothetical protein
VAELFLAILSGYSGDELIFGNGPIVPNSPIVSMFASVYRSFCRHNLAGIATLE